jgi:hypothetical protein
MCSQDTAPATGPASPVADQVAANFDHLLACWPSNYLNAGTVQIASFCDWDIADAPDILRRLCDAGLIRGSRWCEVERTFHDVAGQPPSPGARARVFWSRPAGVHGIPLVEDPRLAALGIHRAFVDNNVVRYQGEPEFVVRRRARMRGESLAGFRLQLEGPSPTHPHQLGFAEVARG